MGTSVAIVGYSDGPAMLRAYLRALVTLDCELIRLARDRGTPYPALYSSGVRYQPEPRATTTGVGSSPEDFSPISVVVARRWGDCDDLAAWRCAELRCAGVAADVEVRETPLSREGARRYHIVVTLPNGSVEDPAARLAGDKSWQLY